MKFFSIALLLYTAAAVNADLPSIIDVLQQNNASIAASLIAQAGLTDTISSKGPFTLLAPTDSAFAKIPTADLDAIKQDTTLLSTILQYHVLPGEIFSFDLANNEHLTSINGHVIRVYSKAGGVHYFNQALAVKEEIQASNGVVYLIDEPLEVPEGTILQILGNPDYNISEFLDLVKAAHMTSLLSSTTSTSRYTVFAPSNAAINSLPADVLSRIKNSPTYARLLVEYHIHRGTLHSQSLKAGTLNTIYPHHGIGITQNAAGNLVFNGLGNLEMTDIEADNGVVHVLSHVLIPSSLAPVVG